MNCDLNHELFLFCRVKLAVIESVSEFGNMRVYDLP